MYIKQIKLHNFRNLEDTTVVFAKDKNVFAGGNAQGKTNLAEALFVCLQAKSPREMHLQNLIRFGSEAFSLTATLTNETQFPQSITLIKKAGAPLSITLNGEKLQYKKELSSLMPAVFFSPQDLNLVSDYAQRRRAFLNTSISFFSSQYARILKEYERALHLRNKAIKESIYTDAMLDIYDEVLARYCLYLGKMRENFILSLNEKAKDIYAFISSHGSDEGMLHLVYRTNWQHVLSPNMNEQQKKQALLALFYRQRAGDKKTASSALGVHGDDIEIFVNARNARTFASQGQKKCAALAMKTAVASVMKEKTGENGVIFLDDVLGELDETRQRRVLEAFAQNQVFITTTNPRILSLQGDAKIFQIKNGKILT